MMNIKLLDRFCGQNYIRDYFNIPLRKGGYLYASDGHIAIRVVDNPTVVAGKGGADINRVVDRVEKMLADTYQPVGIRLAEIDTAQMLVPQSPACNNLTTPAPRAGAAWTPGRTDGNCPC